LGFGRRTVWRYTPDRQARRGLYTSSSSLFELPGGDEFPPGDINHFGLILTILGLWGDFDHGKTRVIH